MEPSFQAIVDCMLGGRLDAGRSAVRRLRRRRELAELLTIIAIVSRGDPKEIRKQIKQPSRD